MSPGQISTSMTSTGGASSGGRVHEGSVYFSAASSLTGNGNGSIDGRPSNEADIVETSRREEGFNRQEESNLDGAGDTAPMRMPLDLEEDEEVHDLSQSQSFNNPPLANPSINLFQHNDNIPYLQPHQSQPVSIPLASPGRLAPGMTGVNNGNTGYYESHPGQQQMYAASSSGATTPLGASGGNGTRVLQQPSPSRRVGGLSAESISPLPWGRSNSSAQNNNIHNGGQGMVGMNHGYRNGASSTGLAGNSTANGFDRPTSAMSSRGYGYGETMGMKDGSSGSGRDSGIGGGAAVNSNANGLQGIGIARAESPAMAELIARVARTEAALADLNQQVASLNTLVKGLQISATIPSPNPFKTNNGTMTGGSMYPGDGRLSVPAISRPGSVTPSMVSPDSHSSATPTGPSTGGGSATSGSFPHGNPSQQLDITNLTHQIAALSASVAQLQRMQTAKQSQSVGVNLEKRASSASLPTGQARSPPVVEREDELVEGETPDETKRFQEQRVASTGGTSVYEQPGRTENNPGRQVRRSNRGENDGMTLDMNSGVPPPAPINTASTLSLTPSTLSITSPISAAATGSHAQHDYFPPMAGSAQSGMMGSMGGRPAQNGRHYSQGGIGSTASVHAGNGQGQLQQQQQQQALSNTMPGSLAPPAGRTRPNPGRSVSSSIVMSQQQNMHNMNAHGYNDWQHGGNNASNNGNGMKLGLVGNGGMVTPGLGGGPRDRGDPPTPGGTAGGPAGIMVSKWEHLPLSMDLQRQIVKYGIGPPNKIQSRALPFMLRGSDIIAQAPPTQERIITYVIPVVQLCLALATMQQQQQGQQQTQHVYKGPCAIIVTTTVDQATQAHKLVRDIGAPLGIRSGLAVGASGADISGDLRMMHQNSVQVVVGTPARLHDVFVKYAGNGGLPGSEVRMLVLDEVDQLIARNLYENVSGIVRLLPAPRSKPNNATGGAGVIGTPAASSSFDANGQSPFYPTSPMPYPSAPGSASQSANTGRSGPGLGMQLSVNSERQTCIFSNTIPTDVINFSQSIQVREPVRVLVRREGGPGGSNESSTAGNLRHYYLYLALASGASGRAARDAAAGSGPGTIGSGRATQRQPDSEANKAKEYKLEALADLLQEYPLWQAIIHVGSQSTMEAVLSKLASRQLEGVALTQDMPTQTRQATLNKWRQSAQMGRGPRFLVAFDVVIKTPEVSQCPLVVNYGKSRSSKSSLEDLPRSVEGYAQRVAPALSSNTNNNGPTNRRGMNDLQAPSVILNFIQAAGGDVEMLRSTECAYRFKCSEVPSSFRDLF
ncbi:hypothetical protein QFC19_003064 [Naganishia cerealis]|uniref:Uncharacterized protein n=1 Tax=Naganishia cerealis TaxID=610337 RepID=A0ACC2W6L8_9TREE|nr:hypothetical protein QFC19_003064 [Naganishia cerealis]